MMVLDWNDKVHVTLSLDLFRPKYSGQKTWLYGGRHIVRGASLPFTWVISLAQKPLGVTHVTFPSSIFTKDITYIYPYIIHKQDQILHSKWNVNVYSYKSELLPFQSWLLGRFFFSSELLPLPAPSHIWHLSYPPDIITTTNAPITWIFNIFPQTPNVVTFILS